MNNYIHWHQLWQLISAHFKEVIREPGVIFWGIGFPILMSLGLGIAFTQKPDMVRNIAFVSENSSNNSVSGSLSPLQFFLNNNATVVSQNRQAGQSFKITIDDEKLGNSTFLFRKVSWEEALTLLKKGNVNIVLSDLTGQIEYNFDPSNPEAQLIFLKLRSLFESNKITAQPPALIKPMTLPGTRYIDFLIPGLIAMGIMMSCMWGISYGMIEKRSKKLLRRMVATPMKKSYFLISIMTVRLVMNLIESGLLFLFAWLVFDISIQGNISALLILFVAGNLAFAGIATLFCSRTANTEIGNGLINVVVMPMMVLSGIFFSYHNFPDWIIPYIKILPLTLLADGIRSIFIEGAGNIETSLASIVLFITGVVFFSAGLKIFKWH